MRKSIVVSYNEETKELFLPESDYQDVEGFVEIVHHLPHRVPVRVNFESGLLETLEELLEYYYKDYEDITYREDILEILTRTGE